MAVIVEGKANAMGKPADTEMYEGTEKFLSFTTAKRRAHNPSTPPSSFFEEHEEDESTLRAFKEYLTALRYRQTRGPFKDSHVSLTLCHEFAH